MNADPVELLTARRVRAVRFTQVAAGLTGVHLLLWLLLWPSLRDDGVTLMLMLAVGQAAGGVIAVIAGVQLWRTDRAGIVRSSALAAVIVGVLVTIAAPTIWIGGGVKVALRKLDTLDIPSLTSP